MVRDEQVERGRLPQGWIVVLRTPAGKCAFLNIHPKTRSDNWVNFGYCTRFADPADAVAKALQFDAEVAEFKVVNGVTDWWFVGREQLL